MKSKIVCISSRFPASIDIVWKKLQTIDTLQYIAAPYANFKPVGNTGIKWIEGETTSFQLRIFGIIPMGIHTITVIQFNKNILTIYTNEHNKNVPVWNHRIILKKISDDECDYTDEIELYAGWKTPIVFLWSYFFYKHRQRKWLKLLKSK